jgi:hypothetical protein
LGMSLDLMQAIVRLAAGSLSDGFLPADETIEGVMALDVWELGTNAAMLFMVDAEADLAGTGDPALFDVYLAKKSDGWRGDAGATLTFDGLFAEFAASGSGLSEVSRSSSGPVCLIWIHAAPEVAFVRLTAGDQHRDHKTGRDGFVLLGTIPGEPITYAHAIDAEGRQFPSTPILL